MMQKDKINLIGLSQRDIEDFFISIGENKFHACQVFKWIHKKGIIDFNLMTDISKSLRFKLEEKTKIIIPKIVSSKLSKDGTFKWLINLGDGMIETVFIPKDKYGTLCLSSQIGCTLNCSFCFTGKNGFNRNLSTAEIISQLWLSSRVLSKSNGKHDFTIKNIVMMGMGEPLMNLENVISAIDIIKNNLAYGLSRRRITLSTAGIVPKIYDLIKKSNVALAISLHASNDNLRNKIMPINKKYNINELLKACKIYLQKSVNKYITFEYILIDRINDNLCDAKELSKLLKIYKIPSKINLIPFNCYPGSFYKRPSNNRIYKFKEFLENNGFITTIRKTRGDDINAACGQLSGNFIDKTKRKYNYLNKVKKLNYN